MAEIQDVSLSNICEGKIDRQFQAKMPEIISRLREGQKAKVVLTITVERPKGSTALASMTGKMEFKMPPAEAAVAW